MYRILLVEDEEKTRRRFRETLLAQMPDAEMIEAASVPEAEREVQDHSLRGTAFDAVVLDTSLPSSRGTYEMNTSLCPLVSRKWPSALVIHCSRYREDATLKRHLEVEHQREIGPRGCVVPKEGPWDVELIRRLATDRVHSGLSDFFGTRVGVAAGRSGRGGSTARLARLITDIERFWELLPGTTRDLVLRDFNVAEVKEGSVRAELGGKS